MSHNILSSAKFYEGYSRINVETGAYETWNEAVTRVMNMHRQHYKEKVNPELTELINFSENKYKEKLMLGAQRALQFGGAQLLKHQIRMYNCVSSYVDRTTFFGECMYMLLCGAGAGFSVQKHHIVKLPTVTKPSTNTVVYTIPDSIEGWADAVQVLMSSYFTKDQVFPEYFNKKIVFDYSQIRPKGAFISGGFKAPGPAPLRQSLERIEALMNTVVENGTTNLRPIQAYDVVMHISDAVISGGVRRSACICMFSYDDEEMVKAKTGNWFVTNPQRARSNNSAILLRNKITKEEFHDLMQSVKEFGEPGFIFSDSTEFTFNPCVEIGKLPITAKGISGWQGCVTGDTKLITKESIINIKDALDSEIEIWNGEKWSKVIPRITGKNRNDFYRVTFSDGSFLDCTSNHKFLAKPSGKGDFEIIETKDLMARKNSVTRNLIVPRAEIKYNNTKNNVEYAYEYGFILGDGTCTHHNTETSTIRRPWATLYECSGKNDLPLKGIKLSEGIRDGSKFTRIYFDDVDKYFAHKLKYENGLPEEIFSWSRKSIIDFIAGWIDSDGTKASNGFRIYGQENKLRDLQLLFTKLGISSSINLFSKAGTVTNKTTRRTDLYFIQVSDTKDLYSNRIVLKSKPTFAKGKYQNIVSVEKLNIIEDSYCFDENEKHCGVFNNILTKQCNLNEINGGACTSKEIFYDACKAAAVLGTLQAGYTDFKYLAKESKEIFEREALLGVSVTGWMNNPDILFDKEVMRKGAEIVKATNKIVAKLIGINPAARTTCVKPSGNASVLLGTASGIHGEHAPRYLRNVQMNKESEVVKLIKETNPLMVEESVWSATKSDYIISFPLESKTGSVYKNDLLGVKQLEYVKLAQQNWIEYGTDTELCTDSRIRHNVSNTIVVDDWDAVEKYVFDNRKYFAGISFLGMSGDKDYNQAPFTTVLTAAEILNKYGDASMFASGLLVEGLDAFNQNLWLACDTVMGYGLDLTNQNHENMLQRDFVDRAVKFAHKYFKDNLQEMSYCLKDVYLLHKWNKITMNQNEINWIDNLQPKDFVEVDTLGAIACSGGACELTF
jgi:hypothetical protein